MLLQQRFLFSDECTVRDLVFENGNCGCKLNSFPVDLAPRRIATKMDANCILVYMFKGKVMCNLFIFFK